MNGVIVIGCERSGTTHIARQIADKHSLPFREEGYDRTKAVLKHSLNLDRNIKFLEWLEYEYPHAKYYYVIRDGREVCRSIVQKVWGRLPHTVSLDTAIKQWNHVNETCYGFGEVLRYEQTVKNPISKWQSYFTERQKQYLEERLELEEYGY